MAPGLQARIFYGILMLRFEKDGQSLRLLSAPSEAVWKMRTALLLTIENHLKMKYFVAQPVDKGRVRDLRIEFLKRLLKFDTKRGLSTFGMTKEFDSFNSVPVIAAALILEWEEQGKLSGLISEVLNPVVTNEYQ